MSIPTLIFLAGLVVGSVVPARYLPDLVEGRVAGMALLVICGLLGVVLALVALHGLRDRASAQ